ncbi:unnamed protein product [Gordionus sp. m RMFG-2023]
MVIYGKLLANLQHHLQKRNHIEQRKENSFTIAKPSSSPTTVIYGKLRARKLKHHLQKRNHIEQRKENFFTIAIPSSSPTTMNGIVGLAYPRPILIEILI